jgi:hypothetical protein
LEIKLYIFKKNKKEKNIENIQFAVYGGICGILGL